MAVCPFCQAPLPADAVECPSCGKLVAQPVDPHGTHKGEVTPQMKHDTFLSGREYAAQKKKTMFRLSFWILVLWTIFIVVWGGAWSLKEAPGIFGALDTSEAHLYATAAFNLGVGVMFAIAAIGIFVPYMWAVKLNFVAVTVYVLGTIVLEMIESDKGRLAESIADVTFWSFVPIIQITLLLTALSKKPAAKLLAQEDS